MDLLYKGNKRILKKKDGVLTNGGFEKKTKQKTKKKTFSGLSESLKKKGFGLNGGFDFM